MPIAFIDVDQFEMKKWTWPINSSELTTRWTDDPLMPSTKEYWRIDVSDIDIQCPTRRHPNPLFFFSPSPLRLFQPLHLSECELFLMTSLGLFFFFFISQTVMADGTFRDVCEFEMANKNKIQIGC